MADNMLWIATGVVGAALGAVGGWFAAKMVYKVKYEKWANEEIEKVQNEYKKHYEELESAGVIGDVQNDPEPLLSEEEHKALVQKLLKRYDSDSVKEVWMPKVISKEEFDDIDQYEYDKDTLIWYSDNVLAFDTDDEVIPEEEWEGMVGLDFENAFKEFGDDTVYVQNDDQKIAYEILRSAKFYYTDIMPDANKRRRRADD